MNTSSRVGAATVSGADDEYGHKSNILLRAVIFVSLHAAVVGAAVMLSQA